MPMFIIQAPSAYRLGHMCILGSGTTKDEAWKDAYGPDWKAVPSIRKTIRRVGAECVEITDEEFYERGCEQ